MTEQVKPAFVGAHQVRATRNLNRPAADLLTLLRELVTDGQPDRYVQHGEADLTRRGSI